MKNNPKGKEIAFKIKAIELLDLNIVYPKKPLQGEVVFKFNINVEVKIENKNHLVMVIVSIEILDNSNADKYGFIKVNYVFEIDNFDSLVNKNTNKVALPKQFLTTINSISISTTRGIMYNQFKGTFLHGAILPIIDPTFLGKHTTKEE